MPDIIDVFTIPPILVTIINIIQFVKCMHGENLNWKIIKFTNLFTMIGGIFLTALLYLVIGGHFYNDLPIKSASCLATFAFVGYFILMYYKKEMPPIIKSLMLIFVYIGILLSVAIIAIIPRNLPSTIDFQKIRTYNYFFFLLPINYILLSIIAMKNTIKIRKKVYNIMAKALKIKLLLYALISAVSFAYLVLPENAGISVLIFSVLQFVCLWLIVPKKKPLWLFAPIFILSINTFISGNTIWRVPNFIVIMVLYSIMTLMMLEKFDVKDVSFKFFAKTLENILEPIRHFTKPFIWCSDINKEKTSLVKRVLIGVGISVPCLIVLFALLSSADAIFLHSTGNFFKSIFDLINMNAIFKSFYGVLVGLYLFGLIYSTRISKNEDVETEIKQKSGDLLILNILLVSILAIYTMFVIIQFRYLFAGEALPYGLTYTQYARKGFFELLFLSGLNILLILTTVYLTKEKQGSWAKITKGLLCYLCTVTIIMLVSSFYRMWLYNADDGLTRLRFLVFGFLIFESLGLLITFLYIIKPKFNIISVYLLIGLVYYLILNIMPIDGIIAESQVDRYFSTGKAGIKYITTLSTDAAPQIARLLDGDKVDDATKEKAEKYFQNQKEYYNSFVPRWQRWNLSIDRVIK